MPREIHFGDKVLFVMTLRVVAIDAIAPGVIGTMAGAGDERFQVETESISRLVTNWCRSPKDFDYLRIF